MYALGRGRLWCVWQPFKPLLCMAKPLARRAVFRGGSFTTWWASGVWATPARLRATGCPYGARRVECGQPRNRRSRLSTPLWCGQLGCPHGRGAAIAVCLGCSAFWAFFFSSPQGPAGGPPGWGHVLMVQPPAAMFQTMSAGRSAQGLVELAVAFVPCIGTEFRIVSMSRCTSVYEFGRFGCKHQLFA